jgi:hypothetical protein
MPDIFKIAAALTMGNVMPLCAKHEPKAYLQQTGRKGLYIVYIRCNECGFTAWMHPNAYYDMMVEFMLDEVGESILKGDEK